MMHPGTRCGFWFASGSRCDKDVGHEDDHFAFIVIGANWPGGPVRHRTAEDDLTERAK